MFRKQNELLKQQEKDTAKRCKELESEKIQLEASLNKILYMQNTNKCVSQVQGSPEPFYSQAYVDSPAVRNAENFNSLPA